MLDRAGIAARIPHAGAMCLLHRVLDWDAAGVRCAARSHLDPDHPLRWDGRLGVLCGVEYAMQAAALHGALRGVRGALRGGDTVARPPGRLAALRDLVLHADRLDAPEYGELRIEARLEREEASGAIYAFRVAAADGRVLLTGRGTVATPAG